MGDGGQMDVGGWGRKREMGGLGGEKWEVDGGGGGMRGEQGAVGLWGGGAAWPCCRPPALSPCVPVPPGRHALRHQAGGERSPAAGDQRGAAQLGEAEGTRRCGAGGGGCGALPTPPVGAQTYFEDNPRDLHVLRHDKPLHPAVIKPHLRHVPEYLGMGEGSCGAGGELWGWGWSCGAGRGVVGLGVQLWGWEGSCGAGGGVKGLWGELCCWGHLWGSHRSAPFPQCRPPCVASPNRS